MTFPFTTNDIHQVLGSLSGNGADPLVLAVVLKDTGSTPRKAGTKALIDAAGAIRGTIGGGTVEAEAQRRALLALRDGRPVVFDLALEGPDAAAAEPICGGSMRVLLDPTVAAHACVFAQAAEARRLRRPGLLLTTVRLAPQVQVGVRWVPGDAISADAAFPGPAALHAALADETARLFEQCQAPQHPKPPASSSSSTPSTSSTSSMSAAPPTSPPQAAEEVCVLVEPVTPSPLLVIAGGGHVGQALARQADLVGFDLLILDDRDEFTDPALYPPGAATRRGDVAAELAAMPLAHDTYVAIVTRGHQHDRAALAACAGRQAAYVGMIGSKRKVAMIRQDLLDAGLANRERLDRVYAPIGLDIGAQTVPEIAASIVAQLVAVRRRGVAGRMPTERRE
jgi:xanthine dehydrogenase accessory factor